jgi:uncharacterized membrane protein YfcA
MNSIYMEIVHVILTILVGSMSGVIGGALGINASFLMLPAVLFFNIVPDYKMAVGTILLAILPPISILAVVDYYKRKQIDVGVSLLLCISYFLAAKYGSIINKEYSSKVLKYWTAAFLFLCGGYFLWSAQLNKN